MTPELYEACKHAVHVITTDGALLRGGKATMFILEQIGWTNGVVPRLMSLPPFNLFTEIGYELVARNRKFFSRFLFRQKKN